MPRSGRAERPMHAVALKKTAKYMGPSARARCALTSRMTIVENHSPRQRLNRPHRVRRKGQLAAGQVLFHVLGVGGAG